MIYEYIILGLVVIVFSVILLKKSLTKLKNDFLNSERSNILIFVDEFLWGASTLYVIIFFVGALFLGKGLNLIS